MQEGNIAVGLLIDLAEPVKQNTKLHVNKPEHCIEEELLLEKENGNDICNDAASSDCSFTLSQPLDKSKWILADITEKSHTSNCLSPWSLAQNANASWIEDDEFDFGSIDLDISPRDSAVKSLPSVDEEEVFFGPVTLNEKCAAVVAGTGVAPAKSAVKSDNAMMTPEMMEVFCEAQALVGRLCAIKDVNDKSKQRSCENDSMCTSVDDFIRQHEVHVSECDKVSAVNVSTDMSECKKGKTKATIESVKGAVTVQNEMKRQPNASVRLKRKGSFTIKQKPADGLLRPDIRPETAVEKARRRSLPVTKSPAMVTRQESSKVHQLPNTGIGHRPVINGATKIAMKSKLQGMTKLDAPASNLQRAGSFSRRGPPSSLNVLKPAAAAVNNSSFQAQRSVAAPSGRVALNRSLQVPSNTLANKSTGSNISVPVPAKSNLAKPQQPSRLQQLVKPTKLSGGLATMRSKLVQNAATGAVNTTSIRKPGPMKATSAMPTALPARRHSGIVSENSAPVKGIPVPALQILRSTGDYSMTRRSSGISSICSSTGSSASELSVDLNSTPIHAQTAGKTRAMSASFCDTPMKFGTPICMDASTPMSSAKPQSKRRSMLPTPQKMRAGSAGSAPLPSPLARRSISTSSSTHTSMSSIPADGDSVFMEEPKCKALALIGDDGDNRHSPLSFKPGRGLVQHTPNVIQKKSSRWSPVKKRRPNNREEEAMTCTKRIPTRK